MFPLKFMREVRAHAFVFVQQLLPCDVEHTLRWCLALPVPPVLPGVASDPRSFRETLACSIQIAVPPALKLNETSANLCCDFTHVRQSAVRPITLGYYAARGTLGELFE
jgi:hypothetical protein